VNPGYVVQTAPSGGGSGPIGYWAFNEVSGTTANDASGNNLHGQLVNGPQWDTDGKISGAVSCDGVNDYVEIPDDDLLDPGSNDFTVSLWVYKRVSSSGYDNIWGVNKWNTETVAGTNEWAFLVGKANTDSLAFGIESGTTSYFATSPDELSLNEWHLLTGIRKDTVIMMYIDSTLKGTTTIGTVGSDRMSYPIQPSTMHSSGSCSRFWARRWPSSSPTGRSSARRVWAPNSCST